MAGNAALKQRYCKHSNRTLRRPDKNTSPRLPCRMESDQINKEMMDFVPTSQPVESISRENYRR